MPHVILEFTDYNTFPMNTYPMSLRRTYGLPDDILYPKIYGSYGINYNMHVNIVLDILKKNEFNIMTQSSNKDYTTYTLFSSSEINTEAIENPYDPVWTSHQLTAPDRSATGVENNDKTDDADDDHADDDHADDDHADDDHSFYDDDDHWNAAHADEHRDNDNPSSGYVNDIYDGTWEPGKWSKWSS